MMSPYLIQVSSLVKVFRSRHLRETLRGIDLGIAAGEAVGVIGRNGAGKSTLMLCIAGLLRPTSGAVRIGGMAPESLAVRARIGFVPERARFIGAATGRQILEYFASITPGATTEQVASLISELELDDEIDSRIGHYSRGTVQRVAIVQALLGRPDLVLLDEPTMALDPAGVIRLRTRLRREIHRGTTVIMNSHALTEVASLCDRAVFMDGGRIVREESLAGDRVNLEAFFGGAE